MPDLVVKYIAKEQSPPPRYRPVTLADEIDKARRRVTRGERRIAEQRGRILELQVRHHSIRKAHDFLQLLESW